MTSGKVVLSKKDTDHGTKYMEHFHLYTRFRCTFICCPRSSRHDTYQFPALPYLQTWTRHTPVRNFRTLSPHPKYLVALHNACVKCPLLGYGKPISNSTHRPTILSTGYNCHFHKWVCILQQPRNGCVSCFMEGNRFFLIFRDDLVFLF